tara:strand:+ start:2079 stop:2798 length:720 start_codon:yes stop_codon:yes gene_type:complete
MLKAKKSLSQNFLIDNNISKKILKYTDIKGKKVLEIGPGYGFLTDKILQKKPKKLILIEKDFNLTVYLKNKYKENKNIIIICADILKYDLNKFNNLIVISNLPYNISTKVILYLFNFSQNITEMILMLQKEVAQKFNYKIENMNKYKFLTKIVSNYLICFDVSSNVFFPKPKVSSSVVKFKFKKNIYNIKKAKIFSDKIFRNVRKKITNNIKINNNSPLLGKRVNQLNIDELLNIYNFF